MSSVFSFKASYRAMASTKILCGYEKDDGTICRQKFTRRNNRTRHIRSKHQGYIYDCGSAECGFWSIYPTRVSEHKSALHQLRTGEASQETKLTIQSCKRCGFNFRDEEFYNSHLEICVSYCQLGVHGTHIFLFTQITSKLLNLMLSIYNSSRQNKTQQQKSDLMSPWSELKKPTV